MDGRCGWAPWVGAVGRLCGAALRVGAAVGAVVTGSARRRSPARRPLSRRPPGVAGPPRGGAVRGADARPAGGVRRAWGKLYAERPRTMPGVFDKRADVVIVGA